ncbi:MAG: hypothetical protein GC162_11485 [Planctomycetes bacterium]|nr:hypothetical protein [Planctomycetota bacterium]
MHALPIDRRTFIKSTAAAAATFAAAPFAAAAPVAAPDYRGPNIVIIRFGGGVRRLETIDPEHTYAPFFRHELTKRGTLYTDMEITSEHDVDTGHGQGTLNILTGRYDKYHDAQDRFLSERFEPKVPTLFEYMRKAYNVPAHQTLIVNSEDRTQEEFYTFSNHHLYGVEYRSNVLSLYRFKTFLLRKQIESGAFDGKTLDEMKKKLAHLESLDYRDTASGQTPEIQAFWRRWRAFYGDSGFKNPRGDRLLTELGVRAINELKPKLMMINYTDPDYVHWGNMNHYTRAIAIIDESLERLTNTIALSEEYRDNTVFMVVPDCGRDSNRCMSVPCQHHFNSPSARKIFAFAMGPGIEKGLIVDKRVEQIAVAPTLAKLMGVRAAEAQGDILTEALA